VFSILTSRYPGLILKKNCYKSYTLKLRNYDFTSESKPKLAPFFSANLPTNGIFRGGQLAEKRACPTQVLPVVFSHPHPSPPLLSLQLVVLPSPAPRERYMVRMPCEGRHWHDDKSSKSNLVAGFDPSDQSNWIISPGRGEHKEYLKPPPRNTRSPRGSVLISV